MTKVVSENIYYARLFDGWRPKPYSDTEDFLYLKKTVLSLSALATSTNRHYRYFCKKTSRPVRMSRFNQSPWTIALPRREDAPEGVFLRHRGTRRSTPRNDVLDTEERRLARWPKNDSAATLDFFVKKIAIHLPRPANTNHFEGLERQADPKNAHSQKKRRTCLELQPFLVTFVEKSSKMPEQALNDVAAKNLALDWQIGNIV